MAPRLSGAVQKSLFGPVSQMFSGLKAVWQNLAWHHDLFTCVCLCCAGLSQAWSELGKARKEVSDRRQSVVSLICGCPWLVVIVFCRVQCGIICYAALLLHVMYFRRSLCPFVRVSVFLSVSLCVCVCVCVCSVV